MSLRGIFWWNVTALGLLVLTGAASMVALTSLQHASAAFLERAAARSATAHRIEDDLLALDSRAGGGDGGSSAAQRQDATRQLYLSLGELDALVETDRGRALAAELHERIDAYVGALAAGESAQAHEERSQLLERALETSRYAHELGNEQTAAATAKARSLGRLANALALGMAVLFAAVAGVSIVLTDRQVYGPLRELTAAIDRFGKGERASRARPRGVRELAAMAETFNATADLVERQLVSMASVAHDLRSPLGALGAAIGMVRTDQPLPDEARLRRVGELASRQVAKLDQMIADLLDAARMETGRIELHPKECDLSVLARESLELFRTASARHELELVAPPQPVLLRCDPLRIEQALNNLVSNAIKYSPAGGKVLVEVRRVGTEACIAIEDPGVGIAPEERERIFEPFRRSGRSREEVRGTGLGLSITRRIVESHGGRLEFDSAVGKGSTFRVILPIAGPA